MEQDRITTDEIEQQTAEGTLADTDDTAAQAQKGILYETSLKQAEKNAKKEKRKGVMQFIKYALCAASAGIIQIVLFSILQAVIPQSGKPFGSSSRIWIWSPSFPPPSPSVPLYFGTSPSTVNSHLRMPVTFPKQWFWHFCSTFRSILSKLGMSTPSSPSFSGL